MIAKNDNKTILCIYFVGYILYDHLVAQGTDFVTFIIYMCLLDKFAI